MAISKLPFSVQNITGFIRFLENLEMSWNFVWSWRKSWNFSKIKICPGKVLKKYNRLYIFHLFMCESDQKSASQTPHKHWVAILITLSCVFVLQHAGKIWVVSPFSGTMK